MSLVGGADLSGTASGDPTDLRFDRPYRASPTGLTKAEPLEAHGVVRSVDFSEVRCPRRSKFLAVEIGRGIGY
eukprot:2525569-Pleurochrysis_carterae.AAC.1